MRAFLLALVVVGCGDDAGSRPDAPPDAATPIDADATQVSLTITDGGVPAVGATVYFQNPDSSLVRTVMTDVDGKASAPMPGGGYVTAIEPRPIAFGELVIRDRLATFAGVKPGDDLHLDVRPAVVHTNVMFQLTLPVDPAASNYDLYTTCGRAPLGTGPTTAVPVTLTDCGGAADLLVVTTDDVQLPQHTIYRASQQVTDGAMITLTEPYANPVPVSVALTGSPAWISSIAVELVVSSMRGRLYSSFMGIDPATPVGMFKVPATTGTTVTLRTDLYGGSPEVAHQRIVTWGLPSADQTLDAGAAALRPYTRKPVFDPATRTVTWTDAAGAEPDAVRTEIYTYRAGSPAHAWSWQLVAPHGTSPALTYPMLPGAAATAFTTTATDSFSVTELETLKIEGGYDRIRARALWQPLDAVPPGPPGQLTYQQLYEPSMLVPPTLRGPATFT
ncbi:MAG TPA: hypothetical protein VFC48_00105, partial [Cellulomonas sp.]|nr:hypothetical protein [Cellulomonas sp.]